jgi:hypothetical protein
VHLGFAGVVGEVVRVDYSALNLPGLNELSPSPGIGGLDENVGVSGSALDTDVVLYVVPGPAQLPGASNGSREPITSPRLNPSYLGGYRSPQSSGAPFGRITGYGSMCRHTGTGAATWTVCRLHDQVTVRGQRISF